MKVEIEIKTNTVTFYPDKISKIAKKVEEQQTIRVSAEEPQKIKHTFLKDLLRATIRQIFISKPQNTRIYFTSSAYKTMKEHHVSKAIVKDIIRYPDYTKDGEIKGKAVKDAKVYKFYSHDLIGVIAPYDPFKKTYTVMFVNKWGRSMMDP